MNRLVIGLVILGQGSLSAFFPQDFAAPLRTVAFGSCNRADLPQPLWPVIASNQPDLWIWMGDNIYADTQSEDVMQAAYAAQFNRPDYQHFRERTPIIGTWDDHDYGQNNADGRFPMKAASSRLALDFMEVPEDDPRRGREGLYGHYAFGPAGQRTLVILLDCRYFASPQGGDGDLLGPAQWHWLELILAQSDAQLHLLVSGIQVLPTQQRYECWARYPESRQRLLGLIRKHDVNGVVFLSGDRHFHEISVLQADDGLDPLVEITSSGLTHSWSSFPGEPNDLRVQAVYPGLGFGLLEINWSSAPPVVTAQIRDLSNTAVHSFPIPLRGERDTGTRK